MGDYFRLRVRNESGQSAFLNVLDLAPDGAIKLLWPDPYTGDKTQLAASDSRVLDAVYQITGPVGVEVLLLVATQSWIDFRPILSFESATGGQGRGREDEPFTPLLDGLVRCQLVSRREKASTDAVTITVVR